MIEPEPVVTAGQKAAFIVFVVVVALLVGAAFVGGGLAWTGTFGDTIGGLANVGTLIVAVFVLRRALPAERQRLQMERVSEVAKEAWLASIKLIAAIDAMRDPMLRDSPASSESPDSAFEKQVGGINVFALRSVCSPSEEFFRGRSGWSSRFSAAADDFFAAKEIADLYFGADVQRLMNELWNEQEAVRVAFDAHGRSLDVIRDVPADKTDAYTALYAPEHRTRLKGLREQVRAVLRPLALAGAPLAPDREQV